MKRDMDLIKRILESMETLKPGIHANDSIFIATLKLEDDKDKQDMAFEHIKLLYEDGYLTGKEPSREPDRNEINPSSVYIQSITWKGYDLLDALRKKP